MTAVPGVDPVDLAEWLDREGIGYGRITSLAELGGGTQNVVVRFVRSDMAYVLKRAPLHRSTRGDDAIRREGACLEVLAGSKVPHPMLVGADPSGDVLGGPFYVMRAVTGINLIDEVPELHATRPDIQRALGFGMIDALAALSRVDARAVTFSRHREPAQWRERQACHWFTQIEGFTALPGYSRVELAGVDDVCAWLSTNVPSIGSVGLMHGDFRLGNALVDPKSGAIAALVDWELATIGDPLLDLAHYLVSLPENHAEPGRRVFLPARPLSSLPKATELVERYGQLTGTSTGRLGWYLALAAFRMAVLLEGTHARAKAGRIDPDKGQAFHLLAEQFMGQATRYAR